MILENIWATVILFLLSLIVMLVVISTLRRHLYDLVNETVKLPSAAIFYVRTFAISVIFLTLATIVTCEFKFKANTPFMEYVWGIAGELEDVFRYISLFLLGYLLLITILVAVLKRKHE